jgi:hypothetical protein
MSRTYASYQELLDAIEAGENISRDDCVLVDGVPVELRPMIRPHCLPGKGYRNKDGWLPKKPWLSIHIVQWGDWSTSRKAFFEVFPSNPPTFIRGEGATVEEAEEAAWKKLVKISRCPKHEFERRGYKSGAGLCKHCNLFLSDVFEPSEKCAVCGIPAYYAVDIDGKAYCEDHIDAIPDEKASPSLLWVRSERKNPTLDKMTEDDIREGIKHIANAVLSRKNRSRDSDE